MTKRDPFEVWKAERRNVSVPAGFSDHVMAALSGARPPQRAPAHSRALAAIALAACLCLAAACQAGCVGGVLLATPGVAE